MQCVVEDISQTKKRLTIEATSEELESEIRKALNELRGKTNIAGFRPGKAPISLVEKKYGKNVESEVIGRLVPEYYYKAVQQNNLTPLTNPDFEHRDIDRKTGVKMVCVVEVRPEVEGLEYEGIPVKEIKEEVKDEDVEAQIKRLQVSKSQYEPVERPVQLEDLVVADIDVESEELSFPSQFIKIGSNKYPEALNDALLNRNKDEVVEVSVAFGEDFGHEKLKGKTVNVKVAIKDVKTLVEPALDDEFAKDLGYNTLTELTEDIRKNLIIIKEAQAVKTQQGEIIKYLVEKYDFPLPETTLATELTTIIREAKFHNEKYKDTPEEELKEIFKEDAIKSVKAKVILDIIGEKEKIEVTEKEMQQRIVELANSMSISLDAMMQYYRANESSLEQTRYTLFREKVADLIYKKAKIEKEGE
ncbi:MAG: trigger factor [Candidatus Magnetoovum sp. WYHC-5]|nr:trigger factor [Candidatus Magnetoovum sp. WYHC-5]